MTSISVVNDICLTKPLQKHKCVPRKGYMCYSYEMVANQQRNTSACSHVKYSRVPPCGHSSYVDTPP